MLLIFPVAIVPKLGNFARIISATWDGGKVSVVLLDHARIAVPKRVGDEQQRDALLDQM
jgi:hypothetical protein